MTAMTSDTVGHLLVAAAVAWIAATEVLRFLHARDRRRQQSIQRAAHEAHLREVRIADRAACARVDLLSDAGCAAVCATFEPDFQVQP